MRYKGTYQPQYVLGIVFPRIEIPAASLHNAIDPESLQWDRLDTEMTNELDKMPYHSRSSKRSLQTFERSNGRAEADLTKALSSNINSNDQLQNSSADHAITEDEDEDDDSNETEIPECSLFSLNVPGVMTKAELETTIDLGKWKLLFKQRLVDLEVCPFYFRSLT